MKKIILFILISFAPLIAQSAPVYVVLFTHIEDNTPSGILGTQQSRDHYTLVRNKMIDMANLALKYNVKWCFQPDWTMLLAAILYEDAKLMQNSNGKNFLRYIKEDLKAVVDPHSHEKLGYNYSDVAHLLDSLGVGATKVIGGHVWDPYIPQFQGWDRFRVPVKGTKYPWASWRGEILMGSGTPNHVNDPVVSGVWRPKDKYNYFVDDPKGNIFCIGQYKGDISSTSELINLYKSGKVQSKFILTSSFHIKPLDITSLNGLKAIEDSVIKPLAALRDKGEAVITDFTSLINEWKLKYNSAAYIYDPYKITDIKSIDQNIPHEFNLSQNYPNPFNPTTTIKYTISVETFGPTSQELVTLKVYDLLGREAAMLVNEAKAPGIYEIKFNSNKLASGIYFYQLKAGDYIQSKRMVLIK